MHTFFLMGDIVTLTSLIKSPLKVASKVVCIPVTKLTCHSMDT